jgi:hypothetical protein
VFRFCTRLGGWCLFQLQCRSAHEENGEEK